MGLVADELAIAGLAVPVPGLAVSVSGLAVSVSGLAVPVSGLAVSISGLAVSVAGLVVSVSGLAVSVSGLVVSVAGISISVSGISISVSGRRLARPALVPVAGHIAKRNELAAHDAHREPEDDASKPVPEVPHQIQITTKIALTLVSSVSLAAVLPLPRGLIG